jgi:hypothetical protein
VVLADIRHVVVVRRIGMDHMRRHSTMVAGRQPPPSG